MITNLCYNPSNHTLTLPNGTPVAKLESWLNGKEGYEIADRYSQGADQEHEDALAESEQALAEVEEELRDYIRENGRLKSELANLKRPSAPPVVDVNKLRSR